MSQIALLLPDLEVGGAQRVMLLLAEKFTERGLDVEIVSLSDFGPLQASIPAGVTLVSLGAKNYGLGPIGFLVSSVLRLAAWIKQAKPQVLMSSINGANLAVLLTRKISKTPMRIVIREAASVVNTAQGVRLRAMRWLYPGSDCVVALSSVMAHELMDIVGVPEELIRRIPNPVDAKFILEQAKYPLEHAWMEPGGPHVLIVSVGRLVPEKDYVTLIKAFALLPGGLNARLIIVGEGSERDTLERLMDELKLSGRAQLVGFDANPWRWIARARVFVLSSRFEGFPNSLLEAAVLGVPLVATEYDASVRNLAERYDMDVVPVGDEKEMAGKIEARILAGKAPRVVKVADTDHIIDAYLVALGCANLS